MAKKRKGIRSKIKLSKSDNRIILLGFIILIVSFSIIFIIPPDTSGGVIRAILNPIFLFFMIGVSLGIIIITIPARRKK